MQKSPALARLLHLQKYIPVYLGACHPIESLPLSCEINYFVKCVHSFYVSGLTAIRSLYRVSTKNMEKISLLALLVYHSFIQNTIHFYINMICISFSLVARAPNISHTNCAPISQKIQKLMPFFSFSGYTLLPHKSAAPIRQQIPLQKQQIPMPNLL